MVPTRSRLPKEEFKARGYKTIPSAFFLLKVKKNALEYPRIGIVIGKAVHKTAIKRNFWKRQAKAALSKMIFGGADILIIFTANKAKLTKKQFQEDVLGAVKKIK